MDYENNTGDLPQESEATAEKPKKPAAPAKKLSAQQIASRKKAIRNQKITIIAGCSLLSIALIVTLICLLAGGKQPDDGKILPNVYAAGVNLGGMSKDEARDAIRLATDKSLSQKDMVLILPNGALTLTPEETGASLDVDAVVNAAYSYGRTGSEKDLQAMREQAKNRSHTIALLPYMKDLDLDYIYQAVEAYCQTHGEPGAPTTVTVSGERPEFDPENPSKPVEHQTMTIVTAKPDYNLRPDRLYALVLDGYSLNDLEVSYQFDTGKNLNTLTAEEIFSKHCLAPQNAVQDDKSYEITPEVYGYGFDVKKVQQMLDTAGYGEVITVDLDFLLPDVATSDLDNEVFADELASYTTTGISSTERNINLSVSCKLLNEYVIAPGAVFSFNEVLDRPSAGMGYTQAPGYQNGSLIDIIGGGIDQTASTLYYCALMADLDILERKNNDYAVDYIDLGMDVCIDWGVKDLKFINNTESPIKILASSNGSSVTIKLLGVDDRDYDVKILSEILEEFPPKTIYQKMVWNNSYGYINGTVLEAGITGYRVQTSVEKIDRSTGRTISTTLIDKSTYSKRNETVVYIPSILDIWGSDND